MRYRNWSVKSHRTFLGYLGQYVSPLGRAHSTSDCFATEEQAISYVQAMIDHLIECERLGFQTLEAAR